MSLLHADRASIHANALVLGETGLLIRGPSGSGKSALSLELIALARLSGAFASLLADDLVLLESCNGRLMARPHPQISGMIEVRGVGVRHAPHEPAGVIHAVVDLHGAATLARIPEDAAATAPLLDTFLPRRRIAIENTRAAPLIMDFIQSLRQI